MQKTTDNFSVIYQRLNTAQQRAVATTEGPVLVIAGPGTGKTEILAARIANILLTTDAAPDISSHPDQASTPIAVDNHPVLDNAAKQAAIAAAAARAKLKREQHAGKAGSTS